METQQGVALSSATLTRKTYPPALQHCNHICMTQKYWYQTIRLTVLKNQGEMTQHANYAVQVKQVGPVVRSIRKHKEKKNKVPSNWYWCLVTWTEKAVFLQMLCNGFAISLFLHFFLNPSLACSMGFLLLMLYCFFYITTFFTVFYFIKKIKENNTFFSNVGQS